MHSEFARALSTLLCNAIPAIAVLCWIAASMRNMRGAPRAQAMVFVIASLVSVGVSVGLAHLVRYSRLLPAYPNLPSGHEALTASFCMSLVIADRRWLPVALFVVIALAPALVYARYHIWPDVIASAIYSPVVTLACHRLIGWGADAWKSKNSKP